MKTTEVALDRQVYFSLADGSIKIFISKEQLTTVLGQAKSLRVHSSAFE